MSNIEEDSVGLLTRANTMKYALSRPKIRKEYSLMVTRILQDYKNLMKISASCVKAYIALHVMCINLMFVANIVMNISFHVKRRPV